jgi:hypothetical protein
MPLALRLLDKRLQLISLTQLLQPCKLGSSTFNYLITSLSNYLII